MIEEKLHIHDTTANHDIVLSMHDALKLVALIMCIALIHIACGADSMS